MDYVLTSMDDLFWFEYLFFHCVLKNNNFYLILLGKNMSGCGFNNSKFCFKEYVTLYEDKFTHSHNLT